MKVLLNLGKRPDFTDSEVLALAVRPTLYALMNVNLDYLRRFPNTPPLYQSGVRYQEEPSHWPYEEFASIPVIYGRKWGDCDDLAPARAAELRANGEPATIRVQWKPYDRAPSGRLFHVLVRRANGDLEDPSTRLGMSSSAPWYTPASKAPAVNQYGPAKQLPMSRLIEGTRRMPWAQRRASRRMAF